MLSIHSIGLLRTRLRRNWNLALTIVTVPVLDGSASARCVLVPYSREHVENYNRWMQSPFLLEMTASEPLTLNEEYEMQQSWLNDEKKCTFIIQSPDFTENLSGLSRTDLGGMVGDVNLYLNDHDDPKRAEIEIMIAEPTMRRRKLGYTALRLMIRYAFEVLGITSLMAKISLSNKSSIRLFTEKLGFEQLSVSDIFQEVTLEKQLGEADSDVEWVLGTFLR
ncbi:N-acetyltransferase 9-like protein [Zopfochytrium polystomum]|nr:N-acetyltransferase 9-like protein [Zopfochytrium polystomum]